jgi:hypothetical protein
LRFFFLIEFDVIRGALKHPAEIDIRPVEVDRITSPFPVIFDAVDGIEYDKFGNAVSYQVCSEHPGDSSMWYGTFSEIPAEYMVHWFRRQRKQYSRRRNAKHEGDERCTKRNFQRNVKR